jgi:hypothetical protein
MDSIIEYLSRNKEWLFQGAGVAAIGLALASAKAAYTRWRKRSLAKPHSPLPVLPGTQGLSGPSVVVSASGGSTESRLAERLLPDAIMKEVKSVPLLMQPDVARHYQGLSVEWSGTLYDVQPRADGTAWFQIANRDTSIFFTLDPHSAPGLALLKAGDSLDFKGEIDGISKYGIELRNVIVRLRH